MSGPRVLLTRRLPEEGTVRLFEEARVDLWTGDEPIPREEMLVRLERAEGLICLLSDRLDEEALDRAPNLKAIGTYSVGYDNIDVGSATERGIPVFNTPGVLTEATADMAFALLLSLARRIVEADSMVRQGLFRTWGPKLLLGKDLDGSTLGVIGAGQIGGAVMRRGAAFGMRILYHSRSRRPDLESGIGATFMDLDRLLEMSDFISLNVPLTPQTRHMIGARELSLMKEDAILINTARGPVIDEAALYEALSEGRIGGAGLDVYEREPELHPGLSDLRNVVLAPHLGSATVRTRMRMARMVCDDVLDHLKGRKPKNCINPSVLHGLEG